MGGMMGQAPMKLDNKRVQVALLVALESLFFLLLQHQVQVTFNGAQKPWGLVKSHKQQSTYCAPSTQH
jgi:hypothetical protein